VCSRDIGLYLKRFKMKGEIRSVLEDLKYSGRSLKRLALDMNDIFAVDRKAVEDRSSSEDRVCSFWISLQPGAYDRLKNEAEKVSFTEAEMEFLSDYQAKLKRGRKNQRKRNDRGDNERAVMDHEVGMNEAVGLQRSRRKKRNLDSTEMALDERIKERHSRKRKGTPTGGGHNCYLELPLSKAEAYGILIGDKGSTHKALLKKSRCKRIALRPRGVNSSIVDIVAHDRYTAEEGANMVLDELRRCISDGRLNNVLISHDPEEMWCVYHQCSTHNTTDCFRTKNR